MLRAAPAAPTLHFVGGKGGVGKTTCAAALALTEAAAGRRTLLISTDPASSLGDALRQPVTRIPRAVRGRSRLQAADIDSAHALSEWLAERRPVLARIALRGTWLDKADVSRLLALTLPGIDEIAALLEISRHLHGGRYDAVIVDTAPTGHTLRMLDMPQTLRAVARVFDDMQAKHRLMSEALRGRWEPDAADHLIEDLDRQGREIAALLRDPSRVRMSWVTLPEALAVEETLDAVRALSAAGIPITRLIINRVTPPPPAPCGWCDARRAVEARAVRPLHHACPSVATAIVSTRLEEPRGLRALTALARELERPATLPRATGRLRRTRAVLPVPAVSADLPPTFDHDAPGIRLIMFGGKGGVGKTTCAAAAALAIATRHRGRRVLLLSTDPAHSLGDALGERLSDETRSLAGAGGNLRVRELDATRGFEEVRTRYSQAIDATFDRLSRGSPLDATHDRRVMRDLIDLAPPGIDELAAILEVIDMLAGEGDGGEYDLLVMDTAPSGHALRLLQMPALVQDWSKALMAILLKYQPMVGLSDLGPILLRLSQRTGKLRALLTDSTRTRFVPVTRAAALPRAETLRLAGELRAMKIPLGAVIVNAAGAGTCARCRGSIRVQRAEIDRLRRALRARTALLLAPAEMPPPQGGSTLQDWAQRWSAL